MISDGSAYLLRLSKPLEFMLNILSESFVWPTNKTLPRAGYLDCYLSVIGIHSAGVIIFVIYLNQLDLINARRKGFKQLFRILLGALSKNPK